MFLKKSDWKEKKTQFFLNIFWGILLSILFNVAVFCTDIGRTFLNNVYDYLVVKDFKKSLRASEESETPPLDDRIRLVLFDKETYESSDSKEFWTPRDLVGETILKAVELGAKVVVVDFEWNRPAPVCSKREKDNENKKFLKLLEQAAKTVRKNNKTTEEGTVIILPHTEIIQDTGSYKQNFEKLLEDYNDVIKQGTPRAFDDTSDYQVRHFRFYERTEQNRIYFSLQILAATYLWHGLKEGDKIITETENDILHGLKNIDIKTEKPIRIYPQKVLNREYLDARYLFRFAQRDIVARYGQKQDPCIRYAHLDLCLSPYELPDDTEDIYKEKVVIIGSTNPDMGDTHPTPVGKMHGLFLIANGINLLLEGLQIHEPEIFIKIIIELISILLAAIFFTWRHPSVATFLMSGLYVIFVMIISPFLFSKYGVLIDFLFPVIGVFISRFIADTDAFVLERLPKIAGFFKKMMDSHVRENNET